MKLLRLRASCLIVFTLASRASLHAQSAPAQTDQPVKLSAFEVNANTTHGYVASESITGSRVATRIADLPFTVSVVTNDFMKDFDFLDITTGMSYVASLNAVDTQGNYNLRGFNGINTLRNGFYSLGLEDIVDIDRVEVIKGPNAAIYGSTTPSGIVNLISKRPSFSNHEDLTYWHGSLRTDKVNLNVDTAFGSPGGLQVGNLVSVNWGNQAEASTFGFMRNRIFDDNLLFKFKDGTTLDLEVQWTKRREQFGSSKLPFEWVAATKTYTPVERFDLAHFSQGGPDSQQNRERVLYTLEVNKRWNATIVQRVGAYAYFRHAFNFNNGTSDQFDVASHTFTRGTPLVDPLNEDGGAVQIDTLANYQLANGAVKNSSLLTLDYSQNWRFREQTTFDSNQYPIVGIDPANPNYFLPPRSAFTIQTRKDKTRWDTRGIFLRQQTTLLDDRLILFASARRDLVTYNLNFGNQYNSSGKTVGAIKLPGATLHYEDAAWSPNVGANYKLTPHWAVYGSYSRSFLGNAQGSKLAAVTIPIANERDRGWDYGVKGNFLENRLTLTAGGYYIVRTDVSTSVIDPVTKLSETVAAGNQLSKGGEFEATWNVTDRFFILASYAWVKSKFITDGASLTNVGQPPVGIPESQAGLAISYTLPGAWRRFTVNGGWIYLGKSYPNSTATDIRRNIDAPGYGIVQAGVSYTFNGFRNTKQKIHLSAANLFDRQFVTNKMNVGDRRRILISYEIHH
jgi:iron complex outermembrane recepter protein